MSTSEFLNNVILFYPCTVGLISIISLLFAALIGKFILLDLMSLRGNNNIIHIQKKDYSKSIKRDFYQGLALFLIFPILFLRISVEEDSPAFLMPIYISFFVLLSYSVMREIKSFSHLGISIIITVIFLSFILWFAYDNILLSNLYWKKMETELVKHPEEARKYYNKAIEANPEAKSALDKAKILTELKLYKEARNELNKFIARKPEYLKALSRRAYLSIKLGDYNDALKDIDSVFMLIDKKLTRDKSNENGFNQIYQAMRPSLHFYRSKLLMELGKYKEALNEIDTTITASLICQEESQRSNRCFSYVYADAYYQKSLILSKLGFQSEAETAERVGKELEMIGRNEKYILPYNDLPSIDNKD